MEFNFVRLSRAVALYSDRHFFPRVFKCSANTGVRAREVYLTCYNVEDSGGKKKMKHEVLRKLNHAITERFIFFPRASTVYIHIYT